MGRSRSRHKARSVACTPSVTKHICRCCCPHTWNQGSKGLIQLCTDNTRLKSLSGLNLRSMLFVRCQLPHHVPRSLRNWKGMMRRSDGHPSLFLLKSKLNGFSLAASKTVRSHQGLGLGLCYYVVYILDFSVTDLRLQCSLQRADSDGLSAETWSPCI